MFISALLDARRDTPADARRGTVFLMGQVAAAFLNKQPVKLPLAWAMDSSVILHSAADPHFRHLVRHGHIKFASRTRAGGGMHDSVLTLLQETLEQGRRLWGWGLTPGLQDGERRQLLAAISGGTSGSDVRGGELGRKLELVRELDDSIRWLPNRPEERDPNDMYKQLMIDMPARLKFHVEFDQRAWARTLYEAVRRFSAEVADGTFEGPIDRTKIDRRIAQLCQDPTSRRVFEDLVDDATMRRIAFQMNSPCHWVCRSPDAADVFAPEPDDRNGTIGIQDGDPAHIKVSWADVRALLSGERGDPRGVQDVAAALHTRSEKFASRVSFADGVVEGGVAATAVLCFFPSLPQMTQLAAGLTIAAYGVSKACSHLESSNSDSIARVTRILGGITKG